MTTTATTTTDYLTMTPTAHERAEWARMAADCYAKGNTAAGHRFSAAAAMPQGSAMGLARFYELQREYRAWLVFGELPTPIVSSHCWGCGTAIDETDANVRRVQVPTRDGWRARLVCGVACGHDLSQVSYDGILLGACDVDEYGVAFPF